MGIGFIEQPLDKVAGSESASIMRQSLWLIGNKLSATVNSVLRKHHGDKVMKIRFIVTIAAVVMASIAVGGAAKAGSCVKKGGSGWGITKDIAQYNAYGAIKLFTGNWPVPSDRISKPTYVCKSETAGWNCKAYAMVCKS